ncbi:hypothetical protein Tco_0879565 [Tanacetum coccineum]
MACSLPHTDSKIEALVHRLINEDKGHQVVLLDLAFQFEDSCAIRDDLRKTYEKCNDISQESRALICTLLKESSKKDRKLYLSMYGKSAQLQKQMDAKSACCVCCGGWLLFDECSTRRGSPVHHCNTRAYCATHHCGDWRGSFLEEVAFVRRESLAILRSRAHCPCVRSMKVVCIYSTSKSSSLAVTSSGLSFDVLDAGLPSEKVMASGREVTWREERSRLALAQVIGLPERLVSQFFLEWNVPYAAFLYWEIVLGTLLESD